MRFVRLASGAPTFGILGYPLSPVFCILNSRLRMAEPSDSGRQRKDSRKLGSYRSDPVVLTEAAEGLERNDSCSDLVGTKDESP
jgi:hypothetical protein